MATLTHSVMVSKEAHDDFTLFEQQQQQQPK
jgi:hypothetical protein